MSYRPLNLNGILTPTAFISQFTYNRFFVALNCYNNFYILYILNSGDECLIHQVNIIDQKDMRLLLNILKLRYMHVSVLRDQTRLRLR